MQDIAAATPTASAARPAPKSVPDIDPATGRPRPPPVDDLPVWFEDGKNYLVGTPSDGFINLTRSDLRTHFITLGYNHRPAPRAPLADVDVAIHRVQTTKHVAFAGPLAGKKAGLHTVFGRRILVTGGPNIIEPDPGVDWPVLWELLASMFGGGEHAVQLDYFMGWLSHAYKSLRAGVPSQGQALALAGPRDCGKSLLQGIVREVLGGREASPYGWMTGRTDFNADLFAAEVLSFGDEVAGTDYRARVKFGSMLKQIVVNTSQTCHAKGRTKITLAPFWRCVFSLNEEASALEVLPPMSVDSMSDKLMLLRTQRPAMFDRDPWASQTRSERWEILMAELPGFLAHLDSFIIPPELRDTRLGVRAFQHPGLVLAVDAESPESRLLSLIDAGQHYYGPEAPFKVTPGAAEAPPRQPWHGTASEMERRLITCDVVGQQARRTLHYDAACGYYLSALCRTHPERVSRLGVRDRRNEYEVRPPASVSTTAAPTTNK